MSLARPAALLLLALAACESAGPRTAAPAARSREEMTATIDAMVAGGRFGGELWRMNLKERTGADARATNVTVDGDLVVVEDDARTIHAIGRADGTHHWLLEQLPDRVTQAIGGTRSTVTFVSTDDVTAVSRERGSRITGASNLPKKDLHLEFFPSGRAASVGDTCFVGRLAPSSLQAVDLTGGHPGWSYKTASPVIDTVVYGDGAIAQVISATEDGLLFSLPPRSASQSAWAPTENWHHRVAGAHIVTPLTLVGENLVFGTDNGFLYNVDVRGGTILWKMGCGNSMAGQQATVVGGKDGGVYEKADDGLHAFDLASGEELWKLGDLERVVTRIGDRVYAEASNHDIVVLAAKSGKELARFSSQGLMIPTVQGGGSLVACDGANLFALQ